jgi:molybdate transport system ATP-binding protein
VIELDVHLDLAGMQLRARRDLGEQITGLFGPSGAGKTSLLEIVAGLRRGVRGSVRAFGETWWDTSERVKVPPELRRVGYVPQDDLLFPNLDVKRNLLSSPRARGVAIDVIVQELGLEPLLNRPVRDLSGGEKKRVALGRALASDPVLLLLDEPFAALDRARREAARKLIASARRATLVVAHDPEDLLALCDEILIIDEGRVMAQGDPVRLLRGRVFDNLARGVVREVREDLCVVDPVDEGAPALHVRGAAEVGEAAVVAVGARDIIIAREEPGELSARNVFPAVVRDLKRDGDRWLVDARAGALRFDVVITEAARDRLSLAAGDDVHLIFKASACRLIRRAR